MKSFFRLDGSACSLYKWGDQCDVNKCNFVETLMKADDVEKSMSKSQAFGMHFQNGADLAISSVTHLSQNQRLPYCPGVQEMAHDKLILFFTASDASGPIQYPQSIRDHLQEGCKVAIFTFHWNHFFEAEKTASKSPEGYSMAFNLEKNDLKAFAKCQVDCHCNMAMDKTEKMAKEREIFHRAAMTPTCVVSTFMRDSLNGAVNQTDTECDYMKQKMGMAMSHSTGEMESLLPQIQVKTLG